MILQPLLLILVLLTTMIGISHEASCVNDVVLVPTASLGFIGQFEELQAFWSLSHNNRKVLSILHHSHHFRDASMYSMCDILDISKYVTCLVLTANQLLSLLPPLSCMLETRHDPAQKWLESPAAYNISESLFGLVSPVKRMKFNSDSTPSGKLGPLCALGILSERQADPESSFPIVFKDKYRILFHEARLHGLGIDRTIQNVTLKSQNEYVVVHWRRGVDQVRRLTSSSIS